MNEARHTTPEQLPIDPLSSLMHRYSKEITESPRWLDLHPHVRSALITTGYVLAGTAGVALILGPSVREGLNADLTLPQAIGAALINQLGLAGTWEHIDPKTAQALWPPDLAQLSRSLKEAEYSKFATEWRKLMNELVGIGVIFGGIERTLHMNAVRKGKALLREKANKLMLLEEAQVESLRL